MKMPTRRQVEIDIEAERVLAPTDWTMDPAAVCVAVRERTGESAYAIKRAMWCVATYDWATRDVPGLRKFYNLSL